MTQNIANNSTPPPPLSDDGKLLVKALAASVMFLAQAAMEVGKGEPAVPAAAIAAAVELVGEGVHADIPLLVAVAIADEYPEVFERKDAAAVQESVQESVNDCYQGSTHMPGAAP